MLKPIGEVHVGELFEGLYAELMSVLEALALDDWERPTSAGSWRVRDVVAHMLDGDLRRLSVHRDGHLPAVDRVIDEYGELVRYLNELNGEWVRAAQRLSPRVMVELLGYVGPRLAAFLKSVDPFARAPFGVAWAGEEESLNWLDVGREYTERWHHQDQIREAVGVPRLDAPYWLRPVLEISLRALPFAYRSMTASEGEVVQIFATGPVGGTWALVREASGWGLFSGRVTEPTCRITLDGTTLAKLLLNRVPEGIATAKAEIQGSEALAGPFLAARAVMV